jgi:hypothetical protein
MAAEVAAMAAEVAAMAAEVAAMAAEVVAMAAEVVAMPMHLSILVLLMIIKTMQEIRALKLLLLDGVPVTVVDAMDKRELLNNCVYCVV